MALTYQKTPGSATTGGQDFEVALAALLFLRGLKSGLDFQLGTNVAGAGAMDDVVFRFKPEEGPCAWTTMYVQLKHKENKSVTRKLLLKDKKAGFLLSVYFKSYLEIQQAMSKEERNILFDGSFENSWFVLFTNAKAGPNLGDLGDECSGNLSLGEKFVWSGTGSVFCFESDMKNKDILKSFGASGEKGGKFMNRLRLFCGQPNPNELNETIRKELLILNTKMNYGVDNGKLLEYFIENAKVWWETPSDLRSEILCKEHDLLLRAVEKVRLDSAYLKTQTEYWYRKLTFEEKALKHLKGILKGESVVVCVESSESSLRLSVTKLMFAVGDRALVLTCKDLLDHKDALLFQWRNGAYKSLVICANDQSFKQFGTYLEVVKDLIAVSVTYRIVFLSNKIIQLLNPLRNAFQKSIQSCKDDFLFSQLQEGSRRNVLAKGVNLQGSETTLIEILGDPCEKSADKVLGAYSAEEILSSKGSLLVGSIPSEGIGYYVDRSLEQTYVVKASLLQEGALRENVVIRVDISKQARLTKRVSGFPQVSNDHVRNGLVKKALHLLATLNDSSTIRYVNEVDFVSKLHESRLEPDEADGAVFVGGKVPLGQFQCNWVGLRFGQDDEVTALRVSPSKGGSPKACILFVTDEIIDDDARKLSIFHHSKHSLSLKDGTLRWIESLGDIEMIRPHIDVDQITSLVPEKAHDAEDRLVLVCAEPGMGKSTLMARLAQNTKKDLPHYFVISITLSEHSQLFHENKYEDAVDFLTRATKLESPLSQSLLEHALEVSGNVVVLLDGFDEIAPRYVDLCCNLLSKLLDTKAVKIWMTSRNTLKKKLETHFSKFSAQLSQFDERDMKNFLKSFWAEASILSPSELNSFIDELLEKTSQAVRDKDKNLMGIPLQIQMLAEVYESHVTDSAEKTPLPASLDLFFLMEQFIDKKCRVYVEDKNRIRSYDPCYEDRYNDLKNEFINSHSIAALSLLLGTDDLKSLDMEWIVQEWTTFRDKVSEGKDKTGFIDGIVNDKPRFIHRVFAEYFVAQWISNHYAEHQNLVKSKLFADDFTIVRDIMDRTLARNLDLHTAVLRGEIEKVADLLDKEDVQVEAEDVGGRTALHLAASRGTSENMTENVARVKILKLLIGKDSDVNRVDKVFGWSPPQYADATRSWAAIDVFLHLNANRDQFPLTAEDTTQCGMLESIFDLDLAYLLSSCLDNGLAVEHRSESARRLLLRACEKGSCEALKILVERNADINQITEEGNDPGEAERIPLHVASKMGHVEIANILIEKYIISVPGISRCQEIREDMVNTPVAFEYINVKDNYGVTAIHAAATGGHSDVVNLLITKYGNPLSRDCDNTTPLHLAAKFKHPGTVRVLLEAVDEADRAAAVNSCDKDGKSGLHYAALAGCVECVQLLVQAGGKISQGSDTVLTPLAAAAALGHLEVVKYLLDNYDALKEGISKLDCIKLAIENGQTAIHIAASSGHSSVIRLLVDNGDDPRGCASDNSTPLHLAAKFKHPGAVRVLLEAVDEADRAAAVNSCDEKGNSVLICGALGGCLECVEKLVQAGGKMSIANKVGNTALLVAANKENQQAFSYLLKNFTSEREDNIMSMAKYINKTDSNGFDAIHYAASNGLTEDISFMISQGGVLQNGGIFAQDPLHLAALYKHPSTLKVLLESLQSLSEDIRENFVNSEDFDRNTALLFAAESGCEKCLELLVKAGWKMSQENDFRKIPLITAASRGQLNVVTLLLNSFNADRECMSKVDFIEMPGEGGSSALHRAAQGDHSQVIEVLINHGGNPLRLGSCKSTPLHIAASNKSPNALRVLLEAIDKAERADAVNACDDDGDSVLMCGARGGCVDVVELLVQAGGNLKQVGRAGYTPLMIAAEHGHQEIVSYLLNIFNAAQKGMLEKDYINTMLQNGRSAIHIAAMKGNLHVINILIMRGGDPLCRDYDDITPLHLAAKYKHPGAVKVLLDTLDEADRVAAVNSRDKDEQTVVHYAALGGCVHCVELLVQAGGKWSHLDSAGKTPLMAAAELGHRDIVTSFLLRPFNTETEGMSQQDCFNFMTLGGETAVHFAASSGHTDIVRVLLSQSGDPISSARDSSTLLQLAVKSSELSTVRVLLEAVDEADRAAAVNSSDNDGRCALYYAALGDCLETFELLVKAGGKLSQVNCTGNTLLMAAAKSGNQEVVNYLLANLNAERDDISTLADYINLADDDGNTAIQFAARGGHSVVISSLIKHGGNSRTKNNRDSTPLHAAAESRRNKAVNVLLEALEEADRAAAVNSSDRDGDSVLICGARGGCYKCVRDLVNAGGRLSQANRAGVTPLMAALAAEFDHLKLVKFLLNNFDATSEGMSKLNYINFADMEGCTVFHHGAQNDVGFDLFNLLFNLGGDAQRRNHRNRTPLHLAAECAHWNSVDAFLKLLKNSNRADAVNACDDDGDSALMCGARGGSADVVELLVQAGGKLSLANHVTRRTPLMEATVNRHAAVARFVLDAFDAERESLGKMDFIYMTDKDGRTAWALADEGCREVIEICLRNLSAVA